MFKAFLYLLTFVPFLAVTNVLTYNEPIINNFFYVYLGYYVITQIIVLFSLIGSVTIIGLANLDYKKMAADELLEIWGNIKEIIKSIDKTNRFLRVYYFFGKIAIICTLIILNQVAWAIFFTAMFIICWSVAQCFVAYIKGLKKQIKDSMEINGVTYEN